MAQRGQEILHIWNLGTVYTGLGAGMTKTLRAYWGTTILSPLEVVTVAELGVTGVYKITYTPADATATYPSTWNLKIVEPVNNFEVWFQDIVENAPSTATDTNAYCTEADVESLTQRGNYTANTQPSEAEVLRFMEDRASQIYSWMVPYGGVSTPGPSGWAITIDTTTDRGKALFRVCREANAFGAAADALFAAGSTLTPGGSDLALAYLEQFNDLREVVMAAVATYVGSGRTTRSGNQYTEGSATKATVSNRTEAGFVFTPDTRF